MHMWNRNVLTLSLIFTLVSSAIAMADPPVPPPTPQITGVQKGEAAPYTGVLLNSLAAAKLFSEKSYSGLECDLRIKYEVEKESARLRLLLDSTKVSMETLDQKYTSIITIKDNEIARLGKIASDKNDYSSLWFAGGIVAGIVTSVVIVYAINKVN